MPETLPDFLRRRAVRACRAFHKELLRVTPAQASADANPNWQTHPWGIGQNGSIAGIVYHVTAWLELTLPALRGGTLKRGTEFDPASAPSAEDWDAIRAWFVRTSEEWTNALAALPDADFDRELSWEGDTLTVAQYVVEMYEHFIYHDGQVQYLKQKHASGG